MIATRTPFRITLGGGGTDLPSFYQKHGGFVLAMGIDKYMYVVLNVPHVDRLVRLHYTKSESVADAGQLQHELAREALLRHGIRDAIEIASVADLPAGTGLGSSSCYLVGLLNGLRAYTLNPASLETLAEEACEIELENLKKPIGKQDQYMAVYGGLTSLEIDRAGKVKVTPLVMGAHALSDFVAKTHLYYTNTLRDSTEILAEQNQAMRQPAGGSTEDRLLEIRDLGYKIAEAMRGGNFDRFGELMHCHWLSKRKLSSKVTIPVVEKLYEHVRAEYGVLGGKVAGAGGGGFWMLYCPKDGERLMEFMATQGLSRLHYSPELEGSRVIANVLKSYSGHFHRPITRRPAAVNSEHASPSVKKTQQSWAHIHSEDVSWRKQLIGDISDVFVIPRYVKLFYDTFGNGKDQDFFEVGSGNGDMSRAILAANRGQIRRYVVSEFFEEGVAWLRKLSFEAVRADAQSLPCKDGEYDAIVDFDVMHHVDSPRDMARELMRAGRGRTLLVESNGLSIPRRLLEFTPGHRAAGERSYTPSQYRSFFEGHSGFRITQFTIYPFLFPFKCPKWFLPALIWFNHRVEHISFFRWQCSSVVIIVDYEKQLSSHG